MKGRVEDCEAEDGEREGGRQEEVGGERQAFIEKSSSHQHFARFEQFSRCFLSCLVQYNVQNLKISLYFWLLYEGQLKELAYSPRNSKQTVPIQYMWPFGDQDLIQSSEEDMPISQLRAGESLLEIHLKVKKHSNIPYFSTPNVVGS